MLIEGADYRIVCENLPISIKGFTLQDTECFYTIFINLQHSICIQRETIKHELTHILNNDFQKFNVSEIEMNMIWGIAFC